MISDKLSFPEIVRLYFPIDGLSGFLANITGQPIKVFGCSRRMFSRSDYRAFSQGAKRVDIKVKSETGVKVRAYFKSDGGDEDNVRFFPIISGEEPIRCRELVYRREPEIEMLARRGQRMLDWADDHASG